MVNVTLSATPGGAASLLRACRIAAIPLFTCLLGSAAEVPAATPSIASAQPASSAADKVPAGPPQISYTGGQLTIHALNATLPDILAKVSALIGVAIDMPEGTNSEAMPIVLLGPGPPREILASLLSGAHFDYMMQAAETNAEKLQSVLIMPRKKPGGEAAGAETAALPQRSPYVRAAPPSADTDGAAASSSPVPTPPENTVADAASNPESPSAGPDQSSGVPVAQRDSSGLPKAGQLSPPATLTPQTINDQLQQMYQQRMQMTQQQRPAARAASQP